MNVKFFYGKSAKIEVMKDTIRILHINDLHSHFEHTENYVPLGQPDVLEHPQPGVVIYYDTATKDVFCRAWCWKNGNRSKLMPETTNAVINVDRKSVV